MEYRKACFVNFRGSLNLPSCQDNPGLCAGSFPNEAVVKLAAEKLQIGEGQPVDPAQASNGEC